LKEVAGWELRFVWSRLLGKYLNLLSFSFVDRGGAEEARLHSCIPGAEPFNLGIALSHRDVKQRISMYRKWAKSLIRKDDRSQRETI
jgi:hypothetical protein